MASKISDIYDLKDKNGEYLFNCIRITCDKCKGTDLERTCTHKIKDTPPWINENATNNVVSIEKKLEELCINDEIIEDKNGNYLFNCNRISCDKCKDINAKNIVENREVYIEPHDIVQIIYIAVYLEGDGNTFPHTTSIISFFRVKKDIVITGMEVQVCKNNEDELILVKRHLIGLHNIPCFHTSEYVLILENTIESSATYIIENTKSHRIKILCNENNILGIRGTIYNVINYKAFQKYMSILSINNIMYHECILSISHNTGNTEECNPELFMNFDKEITSKQIEPTHFLSIALLLGACWSNFCEDMFEGYKLPIELYITQY